MLCVMSVIIAQHMVCKANNMVDVTDAAVEDKLVENSHIVDKLLIHCNHDDSLTDWRFRNWPCWVGVVPVFCRFVFYNLVVIIEAQSLKGVEDKFGKVVNVWVLTCHLWCCRRQRQHTILK